MNDSFGNDFQMGGGATTSGAASEQKLEGFAPVFIKQILMAPEGTFQMFGMHFGMVTMVAIVRSIETSSTKITYLLEDHTARIEGHYWLEEGDALKAPDLMINNYIKVFGSVRDQGGQKNLMVFKIIPVTDPNEITTHILEALNVRYKSEQFANQDSTGFQGGNRNLGSEFTITQSSNDDNRGMEGKQLAVFQAIKSHTSAEGINRKELQRKFTRLSENELNSILDFMISEGHIYSTKDTDHFQVTE